jgi:putative spermidine/putrescine transport system ATP-binding protein
MRSLSSSGGAAVQIDGIRKRYGHNEVLKGIHIDVPPGSFTTFLGPSGSGKTTTLAITTGLVDADAGAVRIGGIDCTKLAVHKRNLGFVFQSYALFPHMTIEKNIAFPLQLRGIGRAEQRRRVKEALALVHLDGYEKRFPSQLSGGQQQRIALARAVVFEPQVLLMDEPLGALDAGLRAHLQREIVRIGRELGVTILYVTHDQDEALSMSDQVVLFNNGTIEQAGSPKEIYTCPTSVFSARFIGSGSLVPGRLDQVDGRGLAVCAGDGLIVPVDPASCGLHGLTVGMAATAVVRPECIFIVTADTNGSGTTIGTGTVVDVIYNGARVRLRIELPGGHAVECHLDAVGAGQFRLGDSVAVAVDLRHLPVVVPSDAGADIPSSAIDAADPEFALATES